MYAHKFSPLNKKHFILCIQCNVQIGWGRVFNDLGFDRFDPRQFGHIS
jgi:hypothetical protein